MKVYCSPYTLHPLKRANRLSSLDPKPGVHLKAVLGDKVGYADYFPHLPLGDRPVELFLEEFKFQDVEYDQKVFDFLLKDPELQKITAKNFLNHQLWTGTEDLDSKIIKYKMLHPQDRSFMGALEQGIRLRLDANALFNRNEYQNFLNSIPTELHGLIDYIEDPLKEKDWKDLTVPSARDFIEGETFEFYIYKPNCEFYPKFEAKVIFSSYLGNNLGRYHTYSEMIQKGDLSLTHGIVSRGFYEEEIDYLTGTFERGFTPNKSAVNEIYQSVYDSNWKLLCSM